MEAVDGLRVSCFLSGHVTVAPARSVPPNTEVVPPAQKTCSPLSFLFFLSFFFLLHLPHITFKMAFGKLYGLPVCFSSSLYFDSMSNIL